MTTKPQASPPNAPQDPTDGLEDTSPGAKRRAERIARRKRKAEAAKARSEDRAASIQSEGFSGKQLRNAMRLARRNGISPIDEFDAVKRLRDRGIDPNQPANPLHLVVDNTKPKDAKLPVPVVAAKSPAQIADEENQLLSIQRIQREIAQRRRQQFNNLGLRLYTFVFLPTLLALFYFGLVATPLYSTSAEFIVQKANGATGGIGSLFSGTALGSSQEAVAVQRYIESKDAMIRLDAEHGFIEHFSKPELDALTRLPVDATIEDAFKKYRRMVKLGYDPTEGVVKMEVKATDPDTAVVFASALVSYAEEVVNNLTLRQRQDQLSGAEANFNAAEQEMHRAQRQVIALQEELGIVSADAEVGALMSQISAFDLQLRQERLELQGLLDNPQPNAARVAGTEKSIARLETTISQLRQELTATNPDNTSLARISSELKIAESALVTRQMMFQEALQALQTSQREAARQVGYLALNVSPVTPQSAAYPRVPENTAMAFIIFAGIYLLMSLTASVLKEQVSS